MYEIQITPEMKTKALDFAREKVESGTAYARTEERYAPISDADIPYLGLDDKSEQWLKKVDRKTKNQIAHWYVGKVGEEVGQEVLATLDIPHECPDKWKVVADPHFRDKTDALIYPNTPKESKVNFRAGWRTNHKRLIVPPDMYRNQPSDFYIGMRLDLPENKVYVYGYAVRDDLEWADYLPLPAYAIFYDELKDLSELKDC